jgi:hypothetical protein
MSARSWPVWSTSGLDPTLLGGLDAIQLAAALALGDDLEGLVSYDDPLAEAADLNGLAIAPA